MQVLLTKIMPHFAKQGGLIQLIKNGLDPGTLVSFFIFKNLGSQFLEGSKGMRRSWFHRREFTVAVSPSASWFCILLFPFCSLSIPFFGIKGHLAEIVSLISSHPMALSSLSSARTLPTRAPWPWSWTPHMRLLRSFLPKLSTDRSRHSLSIHSLSLFSLLLSIPIPYLFLSIYSHFLFLSTLYILALYSLSLSLLTLISLSVFSPPFIPSFILFFFSFSSCSFTFLFSSFIIGI